LSILVLKQFTDIYEKSYKYYAIEGHNYAAHSSFLQGTITTRRKRELIKRKREFTLEPRNGNDNGFCKIMKHLLKLYLLQSLE